MDQHCIFVKRWSWKICETLFSNNEYAYTLEALVIYYETPFCLVMVVLAVAVVVVVAAAVSDDHGYCVCHLNKNKDLSF